MDEVFGAAYAGAYDAFYREKPYAAECDVIERLLAAHDLPGPRRILDLGCGTGGHALPLAQRGHHVVGVDRAPEMIAAARHKAATLSENAKPRFHVADVRDFRCDQRFDVVTLLFAVLGYQCRNADVLSALRTARCHLDAGGLLLFDVWYGPAVLAQRPGARVAAARLPEGQLIRTAMPELDVRQQVCTVRYHVWRIENGRVSESDEQHRVRFFFPREIELL
ncbi:MAG TPA: class I SAM-dependent methyltransferase, partial [Phycisphaerae bacterium]